MAAKVNPNAALQKLCVKSLLNNFDRVCSAFNSENSAIPRRNFEFLQRKFSSELLRKLHETNTLRPEYFNFLINRHLKELDVSVFMSGCWVADEIEKRISEIGNALVKLVATCTPPGFKVENIISKLGNLEDLEFHSNVTDTTLREIRRYCPKLARLNISDCAITDAGLRNLCHIDGNGAGINVSMVELNVQNTLVQEEGIVFVLKNMPSLEVLQYQDMPRILYGIYSNELKEQKEITKYNLTRLELYEQEQFETLLACTATCPNVKRLKVSNVGNEDNLNLIQLLFTKLEHVYLYSNQSPSLCINNFLEMRGSHLRYLSLTNFKISAAVLANSCPNLEILQLCNATFENLGHNGKSPLFNHLVSFTLENADFFDDSTAKSTALVLSSCPQLEELCIRNCKTFLPEIDNAILQHCSTFKRVDFSFSGIDFSLVETIILTSPSLLKVVIEYCDNISEEQYTELREMAHVTNRDIELYWNEGRSDDYTNSDYDDMLALDDEIDDYDYYGDQYGFDDYYDGDDHYVDHNEDIDDI